MSIAARASVDDVFEAFREAPSNSERGTKFEDLMVQYFQLDPVLTKQYDQVSRWINWVHRGSSVDTGIDLVARDQISGSWTAIQCKFYEPEHYLQKSDIDSFFTASGKTYDGVGFNNRVIISTTDKWTQHAEDALADQSIPVQRIGTADISDSPIDWAFALPGTWISNSHRHASTAPAPIKTKRSPRSSPASRTTIVASGSLPAAQARPSPR